MQETKKRLFALALALWALSSCSQDAGDVQGSATGGETVTFSLSAEVSVDDEQTRAIDYKLGNNAQGQLVPLPQFTDGQEVEVHTILKSSRGATAAKTLKWKYNAAKKKLVLKQESHDIEVAGFNNNNSTKWYISGLIGGALNGTQVEFMGTRVVKGVDGNAGDALGSMEVPYAFGWTELTIDTSKPRDSRGSHKYAQVPASKNVKFQPLGSMLAVKLGTNQSAGAYTFTPKGFTLSSNAWGDQGSFELSTTIPTTDPHKSLPVWTEGSCAGSMYYTFANGEEPGTIAHNQTTAKTYYVWVMPHKTLPTTSEVSVVLKGTSSRPETESYKDYTNTWFTDYRPKTMKGKVSSGRVHALIANATHRVSIPIEYVTEYDLAGGENLSYKIAPLILRSSPWFNGVQPDGVQGDLRFAPSHRNDQVGYYGGYSISGMKHAVSNPLGKNLQAEVDATFGVDKYYIPTIDQWWGIFPSNPLPTYYLKDPSGYFEGEQSDKIEYMRVGSGSDRFRQTYVSDYSATVNFDTSEATFYAIRFKASDGNNSCGGNYFRYGSIDYTYPPALDNSMKCAYRFRRIGTLREWGYYGNAYQHIDNLNNQYIIDVVYLGEEEIPTSLSTISNDTWWSQKLSEQKVISRTFPASGLTLPYSYNHNTSSYRWGRGLQFCYWSSTYNTIDPVFGTFGVEGYAHQLQGTGGDNTINGKQIRLFSRLPVHP